MPTWRSIPTVAGEDGRLASTAFVGAATVTINKPVPGSGTAAPRRWSSTCRAEPSPPEKRGRVGAPPEGVAHTSWPLAAADLVDHARAPCPHPELMIDIADLGQAETDLAAGTLTCPSCTGPLQPWGHARARTVRDHGTTVVALRPCRARCRTCRGTHVLLPAVVAPRRADTTAVIGSALQASARGIGYRWIAASCGGDCPPCGAGSAPSATPPMSSGCVPTGWSGSPGSTSM